MAATGLAALTTLFSDSVAAQVILNPSEVITTADYPANSLKRGDEGATAFQLTLGANGRPTACTVTESSGHEDLDSTTCRLMVERAKFDMSNVPATNPNPIYTNKVRWNLPITAPRILVMGVTVKSHPDKSDPNKTKCEYSDGLYRFIPTGSSCVKKLPELSIQREGNIKNTNIIEQYMYEADQLGNAASAFNVAALLLDNDYEEGVIYLKKSSDLGNNIASSTLCKIYTMKNIPDFLDFNPNEAIYYCIRSYDLQYNIAPVLLYKNIIKKYGDRVDPEIANRAKLTIIEKNQTAFARRITPGNEIIRQKDYPSRDNSRKIGGKTLAILEISELGKVKSCLIAQSTYSYDLDQRACTRFRVAADFSPAVIDGKPAADWTTQTVYWIPEEKNMPDAGSDLMKAILGVIGDSL